MHLTTVLHATKYYEAVGRELLANNMRWNPILKGFCDSYQVIHEMKEQDDPEVPTVTKSLPIMKWTKLFKDHLQRAIGKRIIPLSYVIWDEVTVPATATPLKAGQPYSLEYRLAEEELIAQASHTQFLYCNDNAS
eukprot:11447543-Ditylum_brightwellii.AAC.1